MIRPAALLVALSFLFASETLASDDALYRWRDVNGGLHFSNQSTRAPSDATAVELPALGSIKIPVRTKPAPRQGVVRRNVKASPAFPCGPADPSRLAEAIDYGLANQQRDEGLTLIVAGLPIAASRDAVIQTLITSWDPDAPQAHLSQSAIAYPAGTSCPNAPPLVRYATNQRRESASRGLCDDYRRAFAQVGVAANRDAGIARSFREIARDFVRVSGEGNVAVASGFRVVRNDLFTSDATQLAPHLSVPLDPWIVAAHAAQTAALASDSEALVQQLTVALEEIDRAARATSCWN